MAKVVLTLGDLASIENAARGGPAKGAVRIALEAVARAGCVNTQMYLVHQCMMGTALAPPVPLALDFVRAAYEQGDALAAQALAQIHDSDWTFANEELTRSSLREVDRQAAERYFAEAMRRFVVAAESGDARSMWYLAVAHYGGGPGMDPDADRHHEWAVKAYEAGHVFAANDLIGPFADPHSPHFDLDRARECFAALERAGARVIGHTELEAWWEREGRGSPPISR